MPYDPDRHHRRSIRLQGYDYTQAGAYYVTICTHGRVCWLSTVVDGEVELSTVGCIVDEEWTALPARFPQVDLDAFVVMPNHVHAILVITDLSPGSVGTALAPSNNHPTPMPEKPDTPNEPLVRGVPTLGHIVGAFKSLAARRINRVLERSGRFWQVKFYEHIIRDDADLARVREYIAANPGRWAEDDDNPANIRTIS
jgi:putative transposase